MCSNVASLLVMACMTIHIVPIATQCTTKQCHEEDDTIRALTAMVSRLHDTVEWQHQKYQDSLEQQQKQLVNLGNTVISLKEDVKEGTHVTINIVTTFLFPPAISIVQLKYAVFHSSLSVLKRLETARDCNGLLKAGYNVSGVYEIYLAQTRKFVKVYCDMETDGGGWLVRTHPISMHFISLLQISRLYY